jgi:hypothetical protein
MSSVGVNPNPQVIPLNANLVNGQTYTSSFICNNWVVNPSDSTVLNDIVAQAPDFLTSVGVTDLLGVYKVTFTYEGDGSDVLSDVQAAIVAAILAVSGDNFTAGVTYQGTGVSAGQQLETGITTATGQALATVSTVATQAGQAVIQPASSVVNSALVGLLPLLAVIVAIILFVLPSLSKTTRESGLV